MATRRSGAFAFGASSCNPLTGESVTDTHTTRPDRANVGFFVKRLPDEPAYQPPAKTSIRKPTGEAALAKPISTPNGPSTIIKHVDDIERTLTKPISQVYVSQIRNPHHLQEQQPPAITHMHTPPPFGTTDIIITSPRKTQQIQAHTPRQTVMAAGNTPQTNTSRVSRKQAAASNEPGIEQIQHQLTHIQQALGIRDGGGSISSRSHAAGLRSGSVTPRFRRTDSRGQSRMSSRAQSARPSRRPSLAAAVILADSQVAPQYARVGSGPDSPTSPEKLPAAGKLSVRPIYNRELSEKEHIHFLGSSVDLSHPIDFCAPDVGKSVSFKKTVRARINAATQEQALYDACESYSSSRAPYSRASTAASGAQTPYVMVEYPTPGTQSPTKSRTQAWQAQQEYQIPSDYYDAHAAPLDQVPASLMEVGGEWAQPAASSSSLVSPSRTHEFDSIPSVDPALVPTVVESAAVDLSPRVSASLAQRPAGISTFVPSNQIYTFNFVPAPTTPAKATTSAITSPNDTSKSTQPQQQVSSPQPHHARAQSSNLTPLRATQAGSSSSATSGATSRAHQIENLQNQLAVLQRELRQIHSEATSGMNTPARPSTAAANNFHASLRSPSSNSSGAVAPPSMVTIIPAIGNSATGFVPSSAYDAPKSAPYDTASPYSSSSKMDIHCVASRPPAGQLKHAASNELAQVEPFSIANPHAPPQRLQAEKRLASSFDGATMRIGGQQHDTTTKKRIEKKPFVHPADEPRIEFVSPSSHPAGPKEYYDVNSSLSLPTGGPLNARRNEPLPNPPKPRGKRGLPESAPLMNEQQIREAFQNSAPTSPLTIRVNKVPTTKMWKV